jgi:endogenous inhibitor of DNA gyrase (YacG/DUF329 family)
MNEVERVPRCLACGRPISADRAAHRPFCSERCRLIDLGNWLGERYAVPDEATEPDGGADDRRRDREDAD